MWYPVFVSRCREKKVCFASPPAGARLARVARLARLTKLEKVARLVMLARLARLRRRLPDNAI